MYKSIQYPLLLLYGEPGWSPGSGQNVQVINLKHYILRPINLLRSGLTPVKILLAKVSSIYL